MSPAPGSMGCRVLQAFSEDEAGKRRWDEAALRLGAPVYLSYDWLETWWEVYGGGRPLRIFECTYQGAVVALLPLFLDDFGVGPLRVRVARLVGANVPPKAFDPPVHAAFASQVFAEVFRRLFVEERCDLLSLGPVSRSWEGREGLEVACAGMAGQVSSLGYEPRDVRTIFDLPESFEAYLSALPSSQRSELRRRLRQLDKLGRVEVESVTDPARLEVELETFMEQHAGQWRAVGLGGHFTAWPRGVDFHRSLVRRQGRWGRVQFQRITVDGRLIADRYTYLWGRTLFSELPSRLLGEPWDKLGLGSTAYLKMFQAAIESGITRVESGLGQYDNKVQLGGCEVEVGVWRIARRGFSVRKVRWLRGLARLLAALCHKIWYRRVVPSLPARFPRSQGLWWLRYDL